MAKEIFNIPSIHCQHCIHAIKMELSELEGVQEVQGDLESKKITVDYNEPASHQKIVLLLEEIDYPPTE